MTPSPIPDHSRAPSPGPTPDDAADQQARHRARILLTAVCTFAALALLLRYGLQLQALQKLSGESVKSGGGFSKVTSFLTNLRGELVPVLIPAAVLALIGAGVAMLFGNPMAQKIMYSVITGLALVLFAPTIVS